MISMISMISYLKSVWHMFTIKEMGVREVEENNNQTTASVQTPTTQQNKTGLAAMVMGISSIILNFIPLVSLISPVLAILAIVFGVKDKKQGAGGMALTGIITGAISLVLFLLMFIVGIFLGAAMLSEFS